MSSGDAISFALDPPQLTFESTKNALRIALSESDAANVGRRSRGIELTGDAGENPLECSSPLEILEERVIFIGHLPLARPDKALYKQGCTTMVVQMSREKESVDTSAQEWSQRIRAFMEALRLSQVPFAAKLNVTQQTVSLWLTGKKEPSGEMYYRMYRLAPMLPEAAYLLSRGREKSSVLLSRAMVEVPGGTRGKAPSVDVPYATQGIEGADVLALPAALVPHPESTFCVVIKDHAMSPILEEGFIAVVQVEKQSRELSGTMVAVRNAEGDVTVRWLREVNQARMLVPHNPGRKYPPVPAEDREIIGRVLWWIGKPA